MQKTKEVIKKVRKIELKTHQLVENLLTGAYHSVFKGRGIEFSEVREYTPGDDIRTIDWNVTARMGNPYVKEFIEERDLNLILAFDISGSNEFGSHKSKREHAIEIGASLAFAAMRNNDKVGLVMFTDDVEKYIPPRKGRRHIFKIIREMIYFEPRSKLTNLHNALHFISNVQKKRSTVFILSDLNSKNFEKSVRYLRNKHEVVIIKLNDEHESDLPDVGIIELEDEETGEQVLVDTSDKNFRKNYSLLHRKMCDKEKTLFNKLGIDVIHVNTHQDFEIPIRTYFKIKARRIARRGYR